MKYEKNILGAVGNTPLVELDEARGRTNALVLAKLEYLNPGGSMKDRIGIELIEDAEKKGLLKKGGTIVEPTSGNTGVALVLAAEAKGYKTVFTMPEKMSMEKELLLRSYGADVVRAPDVAYDHPQYYKSVAKDLAQEMGAYMPNQYDNLANPLAHYKTTGPEIWEDTKGKVTHFVAPVGTGGTVSGTGKYLKEQNPAIKVIGVDPEGSLLNHFFNKTKGEAKPFKVEGPGQEYIPGALDMSIMDEMVVVNDKDSFTTARKLAAKEGIFAGGSSGMTVYGALEAAKTLPKEAVVVVILPDSGRSYVSKFYNDSWMQQNGFM